ncbi:MAG: ABC transporter ATP-binding protein [Lysobacterales bacterium]
MAVEVRGLSKTYEGRAVVRQVDLSISRGELLVLLGPSGSGKSTLLRMIGGLTAADSGQILVDGVDVTRLQPQARDIGFVFQSYALFEQMSVADNVEFALRVRGVSREQREARRRELLAMVGLDGLSARLPAQLSGGQRQRAALARALAHQPRLLLLDEPFGALDARIRGELRNSLRELLKRLGTTAVFVTHDQEEALALADRMLVMHRGRVLEQGSARQLYLTPQSEFVARFLGRANLMPAARLPAAQASDAQARPPGALALMRPEDLQLRELTSALAPGSVSLGIGAVEGSEFLGASERIRVRLFGNCPDGDTRNDALVEVEQHGSETAFAIASRWRVEARRVHWIPQAQLRIMLLADAGAHSRAWLDRALAYGEDADALVTIVGELGHSGAGNARLDGYRQQYAGDLRICETGGADRGALHAASELLQREAFDLLIDLRSADGDDWQSLLASGNLRGLLLPPRDLKTPWPLSAATSACWRWQSPPPTETPAAMTLVQRLANLAQAVIDDETAAGPAQLLIRALPAATAAIQGELDAARQHWLRQPQQGQLLLSRSEAVSQALAASAAYADLSEALAAIELPLPRSWLRL